MLDGYNEFLDADLAGVIYRKAYGSLCGVLKLCSIFDRSVTVRGVLRFIVGGVVELGAEIGNVVVHCEAAGLIITVQLEIDSSIEVALFIECYFIVFFEGVE